MMIATILVALTMAADFSIAERMMALDNLADRSRDPAFNELYSDFPANLNLEGFGHSPYPLPSDPPLHDGLPHPNDYRKWGPDSFTALAKEYVGLMEDELGPDPLTLAMRDGLVDPETGDEVWGLAHFDTRLAEFDPFATNRSNLAWETQDTMLHELAHLGAPSEWDGWNWDRDPHGPAWQDLFARALLEAEGFQQSGRGHDHVDWMQREYGHIE